jgi:hypothetical protein
MLHGYNNSSISEPDTVWDIFEMLHDPWKTQVKRTQKCKT